MCKLYRYHVGSLKDPEEYEKRRQRASRERLQRMDRCIECGNEEGALVQLGVAAVLDEALKPFHLQERSVTIQTGEFGKPYISGDNIHYNISHSGDYVVCAVSNHEIGVDIQKVTGDHMKLAKRFFHPMEWEIGRAHV